MATITTLTSAAGGGMIDSTHSTRFPITYMENTISLSAAATAKGSALAANDLINALTIPAGSVVLYAGFEVITAQTGSTVLTISLGSTQDDDAYVSGYDYFAGAVGDYGLNPTSGSMLVVSDAASAQISLKIASLTTTNTGGSLRVFAVVADVRDTRIPGITARKS
jgi:hypothetical protein